MVGEHIVPIPLDAELDLSQLLPNAQRDMLLRNLHQLCGKAVTISSDKGQEPCYPIKHEMETVAWLHTDVNREQALAIVELVQQFMLSNARYYRASSLHIDVVHADYEALRAKHEALQQSEQRYRLLSQQLEQRVAEQVAAIAQQQRRLYVNERLASVGQLAAGMAHEINTPLGFLRSNSNAARSYLQDVASFGRDMATATDAETVKQQWRQLDLDETLRDFDELLQHNVQGLATISTIVDDLRAFSRVDASSDATRFVLATAVDVTQRVLARQWPQVRMHCQLNSAATVVAVQAAVQQAVYQVLLNACQAVAENGDIVIRVDDDGRLVAVMIEDNGSGIPRDQIDRIWEPFFTTRPVGEGRGLGLTIARDIVRAVGGDIRVSSEPAKGSCFVIALPIADH